MPYTNICVQIIQKYSYPKIKLVFFYCGMVKLKVKFREKNQEYTKPRWIVFICLCSLSITGGDFFSLPWRHGETPCRLTWSRTCKGRMWVFLLFACFLFWLFVLYWSIADEQCCNSSRWTENGISNTYTYPCSLKLSHPGRHITLSRVPCALQQVLAGCVGVC